MNFNLRIPPDKASVFLLVVVGGQGGGGHEVIVHVEHVGQEGLGGLLLQVQLLHLVLEGGLVR